MAISTARIFGNDCALDFCGSLSKRSAKTVVNAIRKAIQENVDPVSPLRTGRPKRELVDPRNVDALVAQLGTIEGVISATGATQEGGALYIEDSGLAAAQAGLAAAAMVALACDESLGNDEFGEAPENVSVVRKLLASIDLGEVRSLSAEFCRLLLSSNRILDLWLGETSSMRGREVLVADVERVESSIRSRLSN